MNDRRELFMILGFDMLGAPGDGGLFYGAARAMTALILHLPRWRFAAIFLPGKAKPPRVVDAKCHSISSIPGRRILGGGGAALAR